MFELLKSALITYPVLRLYNPELDIELHTDASFIALADPFAETGEQYFGPGRFLQPSH